MNTDSSRAPVCRVRRPRRVTRAAVAAATVLSTAIVATPASADPITDLLGLLGSGSAGAQAPPMSTNDIPGTLTVRIDAPPANGDAIVTALGYDCVVYDAPGDSDKFSTSNTAVLTFSRNTYPPHCTTSTNYTIQMITIYYPAPQGRANFSVTWDPTTGHITARCGSTPHLRLLACTVTNDNVITFRLT
ncbi:hypothetical protein [Rhodococcus sp. P1Y]|uniref:hypothetical protein n=1 Tax=Rhodococcus sp. P1Y TaxID=1302308 RepID=UPI001292D351|nr:hypothetical protein [Rhodococcus sp. P1Y]